MKIGIIGLGLMGASFAKTIKRNTSNLVFGFDKDESVLQTAISQGIIDGKLTKESSSEVDLIVVSILHRDFANAIKTFLPNLKKGATVLDFCGIKRTIAKEMLALSNDYPSLNFIGGHPMAGRELSGIENSLETLFNNSSMLITPIKCTNSSLDEVKELFLSLGFSQVVETTPEKHDKMISFTSQLCHVVSNAFILSPTAEEHFGYSAGSYKDLTRVARLNPKMWAELIIDNKDNVLSELTLLIENLEKYKNAIETNNENELKELFTIGTNRKTKIDKMGD